MKKEPNNNKKPDNYKRLLIRNWIICIVTLALAVFFVYFYPNLFGNGAGG